MRKRQIPTQPEDTPRGEEWLDLESIAEVEITSEDPEHPIEGALVADTGWRAAEPGEQTIRLVFPEPQRIRLIHLDFVEPDVARTQEYVVRWSGDRGTTFTDVVRQQWNFSPGGGSRQTEDHEVELSAVTELELVIVPEISGGTARASLAQLRLA
ncbi:MAG: carbohydrate-binding protein [Actinobacteria bacterium]|nr:carbohydrate-binding protein [Actinomycetota bacterium]